nr:translation initiation factor IF-2-like [Anser cygnoides]
MTRVGRAGPAWLLPGSSGRQQRCLGGVPAVLSCGGTHLSPGAVRAQCLPLPRAGPAAGGRPGDPAPAAGIQGVFCRLPGGLSAASSPPSRPLPSPALPAPSRRVRPGPPPPARFAAGAPPAALGSSRRGDRQRGGSHEPSRAEPAPSQASVAPRR